MKSATLTEDLPYPESISWIFDYFSVGNHLRNINNVDTVNINDYNPNAPGVRNDRFMGFPFKESEAQCILLPVPWDVTTSYAEGTSSAPDNILQASAQLDLGDRTFPNDWKKGIFMPAPDPAIAQWNDRWRDTAAEVIEAWESGEEVETSSRWQQKINQVNQASRELNEKVYDLSSHYLNQDKKVVLIGGDHSTPMGFIKALAERYDEIGVLQIDAHCDLRKAYEGFTYSHASIMYNILEEILPVRKLVQVGIRDWCPEEMDVIQRSGNRIRTHFMPDLVRELFEGITWKQCCDQVVSELPSQVYISVDIDGLDPAYCPHTGTPVPGGISYQQLIYLLESIHHSGRQVIGADLVEVGGTPHEWDGNVGARLAYKLALILLHEH